MLGAIIPAMRFKPSDVKAIAAGGAQESEDVVEQVKETVTKRVKEDVKECTLRRWLVKICQKTYTMEELMAKGEASL